MQKQKNISILSMTKKTFMKSVLFSSLLVISAGSFAESALLTQAKQLQAGTDKVLINVDKSLQLMKQAADQGDAQAQYELARYHSIASDYRYLPENNALYKKMRIESAKKGNFDAYLSLQLEGTVSESFGVSSDIAQELKKINPSVLKQAEQGNVEAMRTMMLVLDQNTDDMTYEQCKWLFKAVQNNYALGAGYNIQHCDDDILKKLGAKTQADYKKIYEEKDREHFKSLLEKSKQGDALAKLELREGYTSSEFLSEKQVQQLDKEIEKHYQSQAAKGASDAYLFLALKKDSDKDKQALYIKAAELNNHVALTEVGQNYLWPDDEKQLNIKKGLQYLEKAAAQNNADAINYLGVWYHNDENEGHDAARAEKYFFQAAKLGSVDAMNNLGRILNEPENYRWAVQAYENGSNQEDIQEIALEAYQKGKGTKKDLVKAKALEKFIKNRQEFNSNLADAIADASE